MSKLITVLNTFATDLRASMRLAADARSRFRLSMDFALSRLITLMPKRQRNREREVRLRGDIKIRYRLNKGDLHSIREIWFQEAYHLPFDGPQSGVLLDLGANIGMTSVWLAKKFPFQQVIAVEPDPNNVALLRQNLDLNGIANQVLQAAIGPMEGTGRFAPSELSNLGKLTESGALSVPIITVEAVINKFKLPNIALLKIDIEGGERELFDGPTDWLTRTETVIIEFHPTVDQFRIIGVLRSRGFQHIPSHSLIPDNMDCFIRSGKPI
jgi:FkbM family methyltransferase